MNHNGVAGFHLHLMMPEPSMAEEKTRAAGRYQRRDARHVSRQQSRRAGALALAVIAAAALVLVGGVVSRSLLTNSSPASPTRALAEAAQQRAQLESGRRLLERMAGGTAEEVKPRAQPSPSVAVVVAPADQSAAGPGVFEGLWAHVLEAVGSISERQPATPLPTPAVSVEPAAKLPVKEIPKLPVVAMDAVVRPAAPVVPAVPTFVLRPFEPEVFARFRASEREPMTAAAVAMPQPVQAASPPVAIVGTTPVFGAPVFGSVDPVPMAAEAAHKAARQGPLSCATIIEQAQVGDLSPEDRLILQQRRCR
jgi:hypothetical protein